MAASRSSTSMLIEKKPSPRSLNCSANRPSVSTGCTSSMKASPTGRRATSKPEPRGRLTRSVTRSPRLRSHLAAASARSSVATTTWSIRVKSAMALLHRRCQLNEGAPAGPGVQEADHAGQAAARLLVDQLHTLGLEAVQLGGHVRGLEADVVQPLPLALQEAPHGRLWGERLQQQPRRGL